MWYFFSPNIIYGEDALDFIENIPGEKIFIISDKILEKLGYIKILTDKLDQFGRKYEIFTDVVPDPHEDDILKASKKCIEFAPNMIVGLGGGSVLDTAKACYALYEYPDFTIDDLHPFQPALYNMKKSILVGIPTTSGTGAETTMAVVVSRLQNDVWIKLEQAHKGMIPRYAIVDPIFSTGMPPKLTAETGFDALAHSIEGLIGTWKNEFSDAMSLKAVELIFKYLPVAVKDGQNQEARDYMHQAATIAGLAFGNSQANIGHSMGHSLGAVFHIAHGQSVGMYLPYILKFCLNNPDEKDDTVQRVAKFVKQLGWAQWTDDDKIAANVLVTKIKELAKEINLPLKVQELGISKEEYEKNLDLLVQLCFESAIAAMSPRSASGDDFRKMFMYAYEGKDIDF
ncbi:MAG: iron-containing alcohol dehydrogenase [Promethearchaeota archaeon]